MKGLHKKIGVGVLVSGLLIGGVSFPNGSVSYASSKGNESSVFVDIKDIFSELKVELPDILKAFLNGGFRGILEDDYIKSPLPSILKRKANEIERELYSNIWGFGRRGNYAVIGFKLKGEKYFINNDYDRYWDVSKLIHVNYDKFVDSAKKRFENGGDKFKELRLKSDNIYRLKINDKGKNKAENEFLIFVFGNEENK